MMPPQSASALDHSYTRRGHGTLADLRERMRELSRTAESANVSGFSHSPESEFVEVGSGHPASRAAFGGDGHRTPRAPDVSIYSTYFVLVRTVQSIHFIEYRPILIYIPFSRDGSALN